MNDDGARPGPSVERRIAGYEIAGSSGEAHVSPRFDRLATEEPLEIRLRAGGASQTVAVTMRTPGNDFELAAGFLFAEGVVAGYDDIAGISFCVDRDVDLEQRYNIVNVDLRARALPDLDRLERHFLTTSACGVCGRAGIEALTTRGLSVLADDLELDPALLVRLPERLRERQTLFATTGGLHAAGLFDANGTLVATREDVGRHNALDKLIGWALLTRRVPLAHHVLVVSGRASYELVQKAIVARIPVLCAVSAPSSLAVDLATAFGVTLAGFVRDSRFNVYATPERIAARART